jgi:hypothetical protein
VALVGSLKTLFTGDTRGLSDATKQALAQLGQVQAKVNGLAQSMKRGFAREGTESVSKLSGSMGLLLAGGGLALAGLAVKKTADGMTSAAKSSDQLAGSMRGLNIIFGETQAAKVSESIDIMATRFGAARAETAKSAALIGSTLSNVGLGAQAGKQTVNLLQRGADMAQVFGTTTEDALSRISAALRGEYDSIDSVGVTINAAAVDAEALAMGAKKVDGEFSRLDKTLAAINIIMAQSEKVSGATNATMDSATTAVKRSEAQWAKLSATIGNKTAPAVSWFYNALARTYTELDAGINGKAVDRWWEEQANGATKAAQATEAMAKATEKAAVATKAQQEAEKKRREEYTKAQEALAKQGTEKGQSLIQGLAMSKMGISSEVMDLAKLVNSGAVGPKQSGKYLSLIQKTNESNSANERQKRFNDAMKSANIERQENPFAGVISQGSQEARDLFLQTKFGYHNDTEGQKLLSNSDIQTDYQKQMAEALNILAAKTQTSALALMGETF